MNYADIWNINMKFEYKVSIIIPTYKDWERLELCVDSIRKQTIGIDTEIIIVNNDSCSHNPFLKKGSDIHLLVELNKGSYAARNKGLAFASGEIILFTDSDCIPRKDWVVNMIFEVEKHGFVGGKIELFDNDNNSITKFSIYENHFAFNQKLYVRDGWAATANLGVKHVILNSVGHFNDNLTSGGDQEWCRRATEMGFILKYSDLCVIKHPTRSEKSEYLKKIKRVTFGHAKKNSTLRGKYLWLVVGLLPSLKELKYCLVRNELSMKTRFLLLMTGYEIKLYKYGYRLLYLIFGDSDDIR